MDNILATISLICTVFNSITIYLSNKKRIKKVSDSETSTKVKEKAELSTKVEMIMKDIDELKKDYKGIDTRVDEMSNQIVRCEEKLKKQNIEII